MCGITGYWRQKADIGQETGLEMLRAMMQKIRHRGPDSDGAYTDVAAGIYLGHKRLSVVDLSPAGHQPMMTRSGRHVIVYNGELYNTDILRKELIQKGRNFRGHSDTEVLIEAIEEWGIEATVPRLNGMFAFAVYDRESKAMWLARDHMGIKPLFWSWQNDTLVFGSELKIFHQSPYVRLQLNRAGVASFLNCNYISGHETIYEGVHKLQPAHILKLENGRAPTTSRYWSPRSHVGNTMPDGDLTSHFDGLLGDAVRTQMVSDVPIGVFLSGGIDSSLVAALMQKQSSVPVRTFTIGFEEDTYNESSYAREVARILGTQHTEEILSVKKAIDLIPSLPDFYDEPFADSSQLPMMLLSQIARRDVTVCLSGDGGDEMFLGYKRYHDAAGLFPKIDALSHIPFLPAALKFASYLPWSYLPHGYDNTDLKFMKIANMLKQKTVAARYNEMVGLWPAGQVPLKGYQPAITAHYQDDAASILATLRYEDIDNYLPEDILQKSDRASMAYALEVRVPLLDINIVTAALAVPDARHFSEGRGKRILREVLAQYLPREIFERPKAGFSVPISDWLRHDLRDMAEHYLSTEALSASDCLDPAPIRARWKQHLSGTHNWQHSLWGICMLQMWRERYKV